MSNRQNRILTLSIRLLLLFVIFSSPSFAQRLHTAPIVIHAKEISQISRYPIGTYRLFRSSPSGKAEIIPFQIDEIGQDGDYVLDQGTPENINEGNGIFDNLDEISFMGDDVGPVVEPTSWPTARPSVVYELRIRHPVANPMGPQMGAVYIGIYFGGPPALSLKKYVIFNRADALVHTSRYKYQFDQKNWLIARKVEVSTSDKEPLVYVPVLDTTTFYLKGDLKYFITVEANHRSIESSLEAWKSGPIRSIIRVSFHYNLLKLRLDLGMYTEISFFSNSVNLPAVMYSPIDGGKSLNPGSGMYYGLSLRDNPKEYAIETNMTPYASEQTDSSSKLLSGGKSFFGKLMGKKPDKKPAHGLYWISMQGKDRSIFFEITPSSELQETGLAPEFYREDKNSDELKSRDNDAVNALGKSPVNIGIWFDATKIGEGEHLMGFRLFFENVMDPNRLAVFKGLNEWKYEVHRL